MKKRKNILIILLVCVVIICACIALFGNKPFVSGYSVQNGHCVRYVFDSASAEI